MTASERGHRRCVVVETNSCASGQKSMPPPSGEPEGGGGYRELVSKALMPALAAASGRLPEGRLAVLYDKNKMEASGYAAALADLAQEPVLLVPFHDTSEASGSGNAPSSSVEVVAASGDSAAAETSATFARNCAVSAAAPSPSAPSPSSLAFSSVVRFTEDGVLEVRIDGAACAEEVDSDGSGNGTGGVMSPLASATPAAAVWAPVRACLRYVTQRPWNRIPPITRTLIFNPVLACLAGGRNKVKMIRERERRKERRMKVFFSFLSFLSSDSRSPFLSFFLFPFFVNNTKKTKQMLAAKAYDVHNATALAGSGLSIHTPETLWNVPLGEVPLCVERLGGRAVVKVPYANAGQGVWTITRPEELEDFMALSASHRYDAFIVQALIGNSGWSSRSAQGPQHYHVGTVPNAKGNIHAFDLRVMVGNGGGNAARAAAAAKAKAAAAKAAEMEEGAAGGGSSSSSSSAAAASDAAAAAALSNTDDDLGGGFFPVAVYARRARRALPEELAPNVPSWDVLGTNLSVKNADGTFSTQPERLLMMDSRDFQLLGIGLDDLIEAYMQTVLATAAIDRLAGKLVSRGGGFRYNLFRSLNPDAKLLAELMRPLAEFGVKRSEMIDGGEGRPLSATPPPDSDSAADLLDMEDEAERRARAQSLIGL